MDADDGDDDDAADDAQLEEDDAYMKRLRKQALKMLRGETAEDEEDSDDDWSEDGELHGAWHQLPSPAAAGGSSREALQLHYMHCHVVQHLEWDLPWRLYCTTVLISATSEPNPDLIEQYQKGFCACMLVVCSLGG